MEVKYPILEWRMGIRQFGISDLGCPRMEEVLRAPAAHGVSSKKFVLCLIFSELSRLLHALEVLVIQSAAVLWKQS